MLTLKDLAAIRDRYAVKDWERLAAQLHNDAIVPVHSCRVIQILCDEIERRITTEDDYK